MPRFSIKYPFFIIVCCLITCVLGGSSMVKMPVDLFPQVKIPVVVVATFYAGMPAEQIESDITSHLERFFTLSSGIDHMESRSFPGVSLIKIFFQPGMNADAAVSGIGNLSMAEMRHLPPGTLPPVVLKFDASSLPVCLITFKAEGLDEAALRDQAQYNVRNQIAGVPGSSVPPPYGGRYRQIMVYVNPAKLEAYQLSVMDVVRSVNDSNLILPSGDVKFGPYDYNIFTNSQIEDMQDIDGIPLKAIGSSLVTVADVGYTKDASQIQTNIVRIDGQKSVYLPILKQGGDSNTIAVVDGVKNAVAHLRDIPKELVTKVVFDQSVFVKNAIENLIHEGGIGLILTGLMVYIFLGSLRATVGVLLCIPISVLATFFLLYFTGESINAMVLGGLALAFSRMIDDSVVVLENIHRHLEGGQDKKTAAKIGGSEVSLPVLAATLTFVVIFFPVTFFYGVSKYLFLSLAAAVVLAMLFSYIVSLTVIPLFCSRFLNHEHHENDHPNLMQRFNSWFNAKFDQMLKLYDIYILKVLRKPRLTLVITLAAFILSFLLMPFVGLSYFPRTDPGQFVVQIKAPTGTRVETTEEYVAKIEDIIRRIVPESERDVIVSNIGIAIDLPAIYTTNTGSHSAFIQASLKEGHKVSSYKYMEEVRKAVHQEMPFLSTYFQTGGLVDAVVNFGLPAPIDIQVSNNKIEDAYKTASLIAGEVAKLPEAADVFIPQDIDSPSFKVKVNRLHAIEMGLSQKEVVGNVITALTSNAMIAPSFWVDPKSGNDYFLTVQYPENIIKNLDDLKSIPIRSDSQQQAARLDSVTNITPTFSSTVINHYQLQRVIDVYVQPKPENLSVLGGKIDSILKETKLPQNTFINMRGSIETMHNSFKSFGLGFLLSVVLVYLILVAQFKSYIDPFIIMLAVPPGIIGAILVLFLTGTTLNVMSLMGIVMLVGIVVSNSILIVEFAHRLIEQNYAIRDAIITSCRVRLRPILMTSLATIIGLIPMSLALGAGSETYASLARVIIGGLIISVIMTVFIVPAAFMLVHGKKNLEPA